MPWQALYPSHFGVFVRAAEEWSDSPDVTTALMKFMMEFVYNKVRDKREGRVRMCLGIRRVAYSFKKLWGLLLKSGISCWVLLLGCVSTQGCGIWTLPFLKEECRCLQACFTFLKFAVKLVLVFW